MNRRFGLGRRRGPQDRVAYRPSVRSGAAVTVLVQTCSGMSGDNRVRVGVDLNALRLREPVCPGEAGKR